LGIDTPETKKPGYTVGSWGPEATEFAKSTMLGQRVALVTDPTQDRTDRYGRTLAYLVRADGWDYSVEAARAGTAQSYVYGAAL
jgi:micrococcal nuclease